MDNFTKKTDAYKLGTHVAVRVKALEYKNDIPKFVKFIRENKEYFPDITQEELDKISKSK